MKKKQLAIVEHMLDYHFSDASLLELALTHPSAGTLPLQNYERLEFLGDAILSAYVANELFLHFTEATEGELTRMKSAVVSGSSLAAAAEKINLLDFVSFAPGAKEQSERVSKRVEEDVYEALVGALFLDGGEAPVAAFVSKTLADELKEPHFLQDALAKNELQEYLQAKTHQTPTYAVVNKAGSDHAPSFTVLVDAGGFGSATATGTSKKAAEQKAARILLDTLTQSAGESKGERGSHVS